MIAFVTDKKSFSYKIMKTGGTFIPPIAPRFVKEKGGSTGISFATALP